MLNWFKSPTFTLLASHAALPTLNAVYQNYLHAVVANKLLSFPNYDLNSHKNQNSRHISQASIICHVNVFTFTLSSSE